MPGAVVKDPLLTNTDGKKSYMVTLTYAGEIEKRS